MPDSTTYDIPAKCKAGVVVDAGPNFRVEIVDVDVPKPGPNDLLIKVNATGLCYSDIHFMLGDLGAPPMSHFGVRSPGHEGAGVVVALGSQVSSSWKVGDRVGIKPMSSICHDCPQCWQGEEARCRRAVHTGLMCPGSYQQYVLQPAGYASRIPDGVDDVTAAPIMCSATTMHRAIVDAKLAAGDFVVFPGGAGGLGIQGVQLAKAMGLRPVVVDSGESKRELSTTMGAETFVDFRTSKDVPADVLAATGGEGAHAVFVTAPSAYASAISLTGTRIGAKVICIGLPSDGSPPLAVEPRLCVFKALTVSGTLVGGMRDTSAALDFARRGLLKQICEVVPLRDMPDAVQRLRRGEVAGRIVVDFNAS